MLFQLLKGYLTCGELLEINHGVNLLQITLDWVWTEIGLRTVTAFVLIVDVLASLPLMLVKWHMVKCELASICCRCYRGT